MKSSKRVVVSAVILAGVTILGGVSPATAASTESPVVSDDSPLPDILTNAQMDAILESGSTTAVLPARGKLASTAAVAECTLDPGIMWVRSSGASYPYGTVGSKPKMTGCTPGVAKTQLSSDVFMHNGFIWFRAAGTFTSHGTGNMEQKSVQYVCKGTGKYPFKVITSGTVWFTNGSVGNSRRSTPEKIFSCG